MSQFNFRLMFLQCLVQVVSASEFVIYSNPFMQEGPFKRERDGAIRLAALYVVVSYNTMSIQ